MNRSTQYWFWMQLRGIVLAVSFVLFLIHEVFAFYTLATRGEYPSHIVVAILSVGVVLPLFAIAVVDQMRGFRNLLFRYFHRQHFLYFMRRIAGVPALLFFCLHIVLTQADVRRLLPQVIVWPDITNLFSNELFMRLYVGAGVIFLVYVFFGAWSWLRRWGWIQNG